jgi:hypothetical protein
VDEPRAILERLERIEALDRAGVEPGLLVRELRELVVEAEEWSRKEGGDAGARAVAELRSALSSAQDRNALSHVASARDP